MVVSCGSGAEEEPGILFMVCIVVSAVICGLLTEVSSDGKMLTDLSCREEFDTGICELHGRG